MTKANQWKWALSLVLPAAVFMLTPTLDIASAKTPLFLAVTLWAVIAWAAEILPSAIIAAILTFLYALFITKPAVAFSSWGTFLPWMCFSALIIAQVLNRTGLGKRIALHCMLLMGSSFTKTMVGLMFSGVILTLLVPSGLARTIIYVAIAQGLIQALDVDIKSRMSSALIMGGYFAAVAPGLFCLTGTEQNLLALQVVTNTTGKAMPYVDFLIQMVPFSIFYMAFSILLIFIIRGKERLQDDEQLERILKARLAEMGPVTLDEIKIFAVLFIGFVAFVTEQWHKLPGAFIFALIGMTCFLPGMKLADEEDLRKVNLSFLIFLAACMSIGAVAQDLNIPKWIGAHMSTLFEGRGAVTAISFSYVFGVAVNFLMTPMAAVGAFASPLSQLGVELGMDPYTLVYPLLYGLDQYLFPYEIGYLLYTFMCGAVTLKHIMGALAVRMVAFALFIPLILVPYWKLIGFVQ
ncbi:anion permease [Desulfovibrio sp. OttesenSCG-928-O18]|nr:anion permease [Desulfovibrio sp. OttesenSCG-928-O18]